MEGPEAPPLVSEEPSPPEVREVRAPFAWILLGLFFAFLIVTQVMAAETGKKPAVNESESVGAIKQALLTRYLLKKTESITPKTTVRRDPDSRILSLYDVLNKQTVLTPSDAKIELAIGGLLKKPASPKALKTLSDSKDPADHVYAKVFDGSPIDLGWVERSRKDFPSNFLGRVVLAEARERAGSKGEISRIVDDRDVAFTSFVTVAGSLVIIVGLAMLLFGVISLFARMKPAGPPCGVVSSGMSDRLAMRMALFLLTFTGVEMVVVPLVRGRVESGVGTLLIEIGTLVVTVLLCSVPIFGFADPAKRLIGTTKNWPKLVGMGILGFCANAPLTILLALAAQQAFRNLPAPSHPINEQLGLGASPITLLTIFATVSLLAPVLEELTFRGILFPAMTRYMKPVLAMLVSGLLFGAIHPQGPILWAALGSVGFVSAYLAYQTGSLVPSMVMHAVHNSAILCVSMALLY